MESFISQEIKCLKYVGERKSLLYNKLDVYTIKDLLFYVPKSYIDLTDVKPISSSSYNYSEKVPMAFKVIMSSKSSPIIIKKGLILYKILAVDKTAMVTITLFNQRCLFNKIVLGKEYIIFGKIDRKCFGGKYFFEINSPIIESVENCCKLIPIYNLTSGLTSKVISKDVKNALAYKEFIKECLPCWVLKNADIIGLSEAIEKIHFPSNIKHALEAKKRLIFDELFGLSLSLKYLKLSNTKKTSAMMNNVDLKKFYNLIPFKLTDSQQHVIAECTTDMKKESPMNRLLQGDVGSGKTIVAMACLYFAYKNGFQSAFMVPTEILARQHYELISNFFSSLNININLLVGSMTAGQKELEREKIYNGCADIIIGTHAIIQDAVKFRKLGLVITDEQHRFGVKQRIKLVDKGNNPHTIVMSATPIPRTLSLILYGDLDVSIINQLPPNRKRVQTYFVDESKLERVYNFIKKLVDEGRQAYIVCPTIEKSENVDLKSVIEYGQYLKECKFSDYKVEIVHGKTKVNDKNLIMQNFQNGNINILITTTIIEVGVNIPNAVIMMIENADRFGLSQIHQLRGRVGRGNHKSYCILISNTNNSDAIKRLKMLCKTDDGFKISEYDLKTRGSGDFFGDRQHGLPKFRHANILKDMELLIKAQEISINILKTDPCLEKYENMLLRELVYNIVRDGLFGI